MLVRQLDEELLLELLQMRIHLAGNRNASALILGGVDSDKVLQLVVIDVICGRGIDISMMRDVTERETHMAPIAALIALGTFVRTSFLGDVQMFLREKR